MFQPDSKVQWRKIQSVGLCPGIVSFEQYTMLYTEQFAAALAESRRVALLVPLPDEIQTFHRLIFRNVHPWAGDFRGPGESVVFDGDRSGADYHRINPALLELRKEFSGKLNKIESPETQAWEIARYLGALRSIHPFRDGNTRTAVVILEGQISAVFGDMERPPLANLNFKQLLRQAYIGNPADLANLILTREGIPGKIEKRSAAIHPKLDADLETEWRQHREEIHKKQKKN